MGKLNEQRINSLNNFAEEAIASNNLIIESGDAIRLNWPFVTKCTVGDRIDGVSKTLFTFSATNQTVEKAVVNYRPNVDQDTYLVPVVGWPAVIGDEGAYAQMDAFQNFDYATLSTTTGVYRIVSIQQGGLVVEVSLTKQGA